MYLLLALKIYQFIIEYIKDEKITKKTDLYNKYDII